MTRSEVCAQIVAQRGEHHHFIKTWESGHTFVDVELIDRFLQQCDGHGTIEGFELLDLEQTWQLLIELDPDNLQRVRKETGEVIEWEWRNGEGAIRKTVYPFTPAGIMTIIDDEFFA